MNNQKRDNNECKECCKLLVNDCFDILFDKYIITNEKLSLMARSNESLIKTMSLEQIIALRDSLKEIFDYNHDFNEISMNFFFDSKQKPNFENLVKFIKGHKCYYYKAIFFAIIKTLLIIMQLISSIIIFYPKNGFFNSPFEIKRRTVFCLKILYFLFFDLFYIINEFYFLKNFERKKYKKRNALIYQILGYICNGIIYLLILFNNKNNDNAEKDDIVFYKKDNIIESIISMFFDVVKYFIK